MEEFPFISIIIPAWDDETVIGPTLDAIKNADYPKEKCEIIVIAGGNDDTYAVAEKYSKEMEDFSRFVLLKQEPRGKNAALQKGLEERNEKSDFVVLLDADTVVEKNWFKKVVEYFSAENVSVINGDYYPIKGINHVSVFYLYEKIKLKSIDNIPALYGGGGIVLKREVLDSEDISELFNENVLVGIDYHLTNKLIEKRYSIGFAKGAKAYTYLPSAYKEFVEAESRWIKAWLKISSVQKWFNVRILKNLLVVFSPLFLFFIYLLETPIYLYIIGTPFLIFSLKTMKRGLQVYSREKDRMYLKYILSYLFFSFLLEVLITFLFLKMKLFGLKQEKHFKGPRPN
jgi:cellulose synthase/poly-beta-1,6-N-acetylglucosamine synthase-like glycosyltransferase